MVSVLVLLRCCKCGTCFGGLLLEALHSSGTEPAFPAGLMHLHWAPPPAPPPPPENNARV